MCSWVVAVAVYARQGVVNVTIPPAAATLPSGPEAPPPQSVPASASAVYTSPVTWRLASAPFADGVGAYFSVAIGPSTPLQLTGTAPPNLPAGYSAASVAIPLGSERGITISTGQAATGVRVDGLTGGAAFASSLSRPLSPAGYVFDVLFPPPLTQLIYVRLPSGTLVTGTEGNSSAGAAVSPSNEADLWLAVPYTAPQSSGDGGSGAGFGRGVSDTWLVANSSLPSSDVALLSTAGLTILRSSMAAGLGLADAARVVITGFVGAGSSSGSRGRRLASSASPAPSFLATVLVVTTGLNGSTCTLLSPSCAPPLLCLSTAGTANTTGELAGAFVALGRGGALLAQWSKQASARVRERG